MILDDTCGDCQFFQRCQFLIQVTANQSECDFTPSRFLRGEQGVPHALWCAVYVGRDCDCNRDEPDFDDED